MRPDAIGPSSNVHCEHCTNIQARTHTTHSRMDMFIHNICSNSECLIIKCMCCCWAAAGCAPASSRFLLCIISSIYFAHFCRANGRSKQKLWPARGILAM